jgi:hypothetical protein
LGYSEDVLNSVSTEPPAVRAEAPDAAAVAGPDAHQSAWYGRLLLGFGVPVPSPQESALELDGYGSPRYLLGLEAAGLLSESLALGGFVFATGRSDASHYQGPDLDEEAYAAGVTLPLFVRLRSSAAVVITPRLGLGFGSQSLHHHASYRVGPSAGVDAALIFLRAHLGVAVGVWSLRLPGKGVAESNDYGSLFLTVNLAVGG